MRSLEHQRTTQTADEASEMGQMGDVTHCEHRSEGTG